MTDLKFNWDKITGSLGKEGENIFETEVRKIKDLCNGYDYEKNSSNIISIVGNRGCGKTSLINAVQEKLKKDKNFFVTNIIDPSIFDDTLLIPEFFISLLADEVEKYKEVKERNNSEKKTGYEYIRFNKKLNEIMDVISHIKSNKERFYEDNCASDIVKNIQKRSNFASLLKELMDAFYGILGKDSKTKMVVCIDDLDLVANQYVYQMIEDIQKWLNKNCVVILSFREIQLLNIIQDHFIRQNKNLMEKQIVSIAEIKDQAVQFYEKQMPVSRRIYLKGQKEFFTEKAWIILEPFAVKVGNESSSEEKNEYEKTNLHDLMENLVREKLALPLDPVDEKEKVHLIYPNGLREMLAFVRMLMEMDDIRDKENGIKTAELQSNLKKYRDYILSRAKANLNMEYYSILEEWLKTSVRNKNYYICSKLDGILNSKEYDIVFIKKTETYNVMMGDVFQFLENIKIELSSNEQIMYLCYLIKLLYSIELLNSFLDLANKDIIRSFGDISFDDQKDYSLLINGKFMPETFGYTYSFENFINYVDNETKILDEEVKKFINSICYSKIMRNSRIWTETRSYSERINNSYRKYRPVFDDEYINDSEKINYRTDPMTAVLKREYFENSANSGYVFYSVFDIDVFVRISFDNQQKEKLKYVYEKINRMLDGKNTTFYTPYEKMLKEKISLLLKRKEDNIIVFDDVLIENIERIKKDIDRDFGNLNNFDEAVVKMKLKQLTIYDARDFVEQLLSLTELSDKDKGKIKEIRNTLNIKKRRKIWDSEMDTFIYIFKNYPNAKAILEKMTEENEKS